MQLVLPPSLFSLENPRRVPTSRIHHGTYRGRADTDAGTSPFGGDELAARARDKSRAVGQVLGQRVGQRRAVRTDTGRRTGPFR